MSEKIGESALTCKEIMYKESLLLYYDWLLCIAKCTGYIVSAITRVQEIQYLWPDLWKPDIIVYFSNSILLHFYNLHTRMYVLAKFQLRILKAFEVMALQSSSNRFQCFILKNLYFAIVFGFRRSGHIFSQLGITIISLYFHNKYSLHIQYLWLLFSRYFHPIFISI